MDNTIILTILAFVAELLFFIALHVGVAKYAAKENSLNVWGNLFFGFGFGLFSQFVSAVSGANLRNWQEKPFANTGVLALMLPSTSLYGFIIYSVCQYYLY